MEVMNPDLKYSNRKRDFGRGFYLTSSKEQAISWARHRTKIQQSGKATITVYELDDLYIKNLNIKKFESADLEWLEFITKNRKSEENVDVPYDLIIGPVANDNTTPTINLYLTGIINSDVAIESLKTYVLKDQYVIKSETALSYLKEKQVIICE